MLCSIDCMHLEWINCPKAWHGQFGRAGVNNDLAVLNHSLLFDDLLDDIAPVVPYEVNEVRFEKGYYLADGIYPSGQLLSNHLRLHETREMSYLNVVKKVLEKTLKELLVSSKCRLGKVVRFRKKGKLAPRFVGPFEIIKKVGPVAYRLDLPKELDDVHDMFHVSNLKKCLADPTLQVPLDEIQVDAKLNFVEELVEILEREFKKLKRSRIAIVKVR
ncbi:putative reverse transcriptase domain-containing protein [Tanacetum coccineum]